MAFGKSSLLKMSDQTFDFVCTACAEDNNTVEAVKYCVECSGYCCQPCTDVHKKFPALKNHNLMEVDHVSQGSGQSPKRLEIPTERCSIHVAKVLDMYCEGHNVVGCSTCFVKDHKSCPDSHIHSIPDMIDTMFKLSDCKQTQSLLQDMMVSMKTVSKSKDTLLETLKEAKKEALDQVTTFQKALEAIIRKAAESSTQEIEDAYKGLEATILQDKHVAEDICDDLKVTDDKLSKSEGNRAQKFVCTKLAQEKIKKADKEKSIQESQEFHPPITFTPDHPLMGYIKALDGIGQVQKHEKQKHDLYKITGRRYINIKLPDDSKQCYSHGCCLTPDNQLLVTDANNKKLKRFGVQKMSVVDYCTLDSEPRGVCCISKHEVAVACWSGDKIQFVSIHGKMTPTRQIKMTHECYGVAFNDGKLYVTDWSKSLYVYDMTGTRLKTISQDNAGNKLFNTSKHVTFNETGNKMFVGGGENGVVGFDGLGMLFNGTDSHLGFADGVCIDGRGNMFVVGYRSHNVVQFSESGKKVGVVVKQIDGLHHPRSVCYHQRLNRMYVTIKDSNVVKMYELNSAN